jgi:hypothetical protein
VCPNVRISTKRLQQHTCPAGDDFFFRVHPFTLAFRIGCRSFTTVRP